MIDKELRPYLNEIWSLAMDINSREKNTVVIDFAGYIERIEIFVYKNGYKNSKLDKNGFKINDFEMGICFNDNYRDYGYYDDFYDTRQKRIDILKMTIEELKKLKGE